MRASELYLSVRVHFCVLPPPNHTSQQKKGRPKAAPRWRLLLREDGCILLGLSSRSHGLKRVYCALNRGLTRTLLRFNTEEIDGIGIQATYLDHVVSAPAS